MSNADDVRAAIAAGVAGSEPAFRELLQSVAGTARAIFGARAASIFLLDPEADELVFEAVAGEGGEDLIGRRFPAGVGIAGFVLSTQQPLVVEDVAADPRFARELAESTGYVPRGLMAVPLLRGERALGVLEVLDRPRRTRFSLEELELLGLFAGQAAIALDLLRHARRARRLLTGDGGELAALARVAERLAGGAGRRSAAAARLLAALDDLLQ